MKKKFIIFMLLISLMIYGLVACKKEEKQEISEEPTTGEEIIEEKENIPANQNLLTGVVDLSEEAIGMRPVAVMVNNVEAALPQYGVAQADLIFEIPVEGNFTRLMAMYGDYTKVPTICSVRSARKYFPAMSEGFDAIYVHWGMYKVIFDYIESLGLTRYDGMTNTGGLYGRDQARLNAGYALEHTSYFDGTGLPAALVQRGDRIELTEDKKGPAFLFNGMEEQVVPSEDACTTVGIDFGSTTATLFYDSNTNTYLKQINGKNQMDSVAGTQLAFTNVLILETDITDDPNGIHRLVDWTGGEDSVGYYISNGAIQQIKWSKESEESYLKLYNMQGEELAINRGKTYIAVNYRDQATFE